MRMNYTPLGVVFTDFLLNSVGAGLFELSHDYFTKQTLVIRTAGGGGGTALTETTDYVLSGEDVALSALVTSARGTGCNAMRYIQIVNAAYQACDLFFTGDFTADSDEAGDINTMGYKAVTANYTILDWENYRTYGVTTAAGAITLLLPTVADNIGKRVRMVKADAGAGTAILDGEGAEKIGTKGVQTTFTLYGQGDWVEVESNGVLWEVVGMGFNELPYVPVITGFGVPTSVSASRVRCGNKLKGIVKFTPGTPTAVEGRISIGPAGDALVSDAVLIPSIMECGNIVKSGAGACAIYCLIESGVAYITIGVQSATAAGLSKMTGNYFGVGETLTLRYELPISGWNG
jgi:hypothetical protein